MYGTRTRVARVKGGSPRPLDEHDISTSLEAGAGIEPAITILQTVALPLGDPAAVLCEDDSLEEWDCQQKNVYIENFFIGEINSFLEEV